MSPLGAGLLGDAGEEAYRIKHVFRLLKRGERHSIANVIIPPGEARMFVGALAPGTVHNS
jgi:hypothetical protein